MIIVMMMMMMMVMVMVMVMMTPADMLALSPDTLNTLLNSLMFLSAAAWFDPSLVLKGRDLRIS